MITFKTYCPPRLQDYIRFFWYMEVHGTLEEQIIPDGHQEVIICVSSTKPLRRDEGGWIEEPRSFLIGQTTRSYSLVLKEKTRLYGIRFHPHALPLFLRIAASSLTNQVLPLPSVPLAQKLEELIETFPDHTFRRFEVYLSSLLNQSKIESHPFSYVAYCMQQMRQSHGQVRVEALKKGAGISFKYLDLLFDHYVGVTPKKFCTILQLNRFIHLKNTTPQKNLTRCGYEAGFSDQSHLIKTFRAYTGHSPLHYFSQPNLINTPFIH